MMISLTELSLFCKNKNKLEWYKEVCQNEDFGNMIMPSEDMNIF